ncbi:MAG: glycosyltransferase [Parcubacteria group bacterium]|nr:glycosyltransferase [Parcubacteria group bacterium]
MSPIKTLSVFFPAYNEEDNIANTVSQAIEVLKTLKLDDYEVIVVDDGSADNTAAIVQTLAAKNSKVRLIRHPTNRGYGGALKTGFSSAKFDWIAFTDSDGQFDFREITKFLDHIPNYQVVAGYRKHRSDSKFRRMMALLLRIWDTVLFGLNLKDVDCGFKLIKKSVINQVFPLVTESAITETEMMAKIHRAGFPIKQVGVAHHSRTEGAQTGGNFKVIFKAAIESLKLFLHLNPISPFLISILAVAAFFRLFRLRDYLVFLGDEGRDMLVWFNMVYRGEFTFLGPTASVGGFYLGPIYYYLSLPFYFLVRDPVGPAIFVAITGILTVWLIYHVCLNWFGKTAGLFAAWTYATAALIIRYSRASWNPNPVPFFTLLGVYLAAAGPGKFRYFKIIAAGICLGILFQLHYLTVILAPIFLFIVIYQTITYNRKLHLRSLFTVICSLVTGWIIGFSPFLAFEIYHNFPNTRTVTEFVTRPGGGVLNFELLGLVRSVIRNTARLYQTVLLWSDNPLTHLVAYTTVVVATLSALKQKRLALLIWFYLGIIIFSLYQGSISDYYYGFLFPVPFIFAAASAQYLWKSFPSGKPLVLLLLALLTLDQSNRWFLNQKPNRLLNQTESVSQKVIDLSENRPYNFALITGGNSDHAYRYFLEIHQTPPTPLSSQITDQLIAVCEKPQPECQPLGNPIWEIAGFGRAEIDTQKTVPPGITVYRLIHYQEL